MPKKKKVETPDPHALYQLSVQNPEFELDFMEKVFRKSRKRKPVILREDFCGTALSACEWVKRGRRNKSIAFDIDQGVIDWGCKHNRSPLTSTQKDRVEICRKNVLYAKPHKVDMCQAFNFSYWIFQERKILLKYFKNVYRSLNDDGIFFLDAFGGYEAHKTQKEKREVDDFHYIWEQEKYNAATAEMHCKIHFQLPGGKKIKDAFSYTWRLWGAKEIREVLADAGFKNTQLYLQEFDEETDEPLDNFVATEYAEDYACWVGYIVAEK